MAMEIQGEDVIAVMRSIMFTMYGPNKKNCIINKSYNKEVQILEHKTTIGLIMF